MSAIGPGGKPVDQSPSIEDVFTPPDEPAHDNFVEQAGTGPQTLTWNGLLDDGTTAPDGVYTLQLTITDELTTFTRTATVTLDSTAPVITVLSYKTLRFRLSEPVTLTLVVGTARYSRTLKKATTT